MDKKLDRSTEKKKVLHIVRQLDFGGVELQCAMIAEHSAVSGYHHTFLAITHDGEAGRRTRAAGGEVVCLSSPSRIPSIVTIVRLMREIRRQKPSIVHTRGAEANFHGVIAARLAGVKIIVAEEIGIPRHSQKAALVFKLIYRLTKKIVAISEAVKDAVVDLKEVPRDKVDVIYNPVIAPSTFVSVKDFCPLHIGFVGRLEPVKNAMSLVEAVKILLDEGRDVHLHVVGDGNEKHEIEELICRLGMLDKVTMYGFLAQPFSVLRGCNLYVQPSLSEGFGIALVEASLFGLPLLVSANGGTVEIVQHEHNGWLLEGVSAAQIAKGIRSFIDLPDEKKRLVARTGRLEFENKYTVGSYLHSLDSLYASLRGNLGT